VGRHAATCVLIVAAWTAAWAQIVPVSQEPHHRLVFEDARLRVLDVNIPPGVTTLEHSHDHDLVTVSIGQADTRIRLHGADWGPVRPRRPLGQVGTTEYAGQTGIHTIRNVGPDPYHLIAVENVRQSGWHATPAAGAPGVTVAAESRAFRASSIQLDAARRSVTRALSLPAVIVLVTGEAVLARQGHDSRPLNASARWTVLPPLEEYTVASHGGEARLVEIEVR
jgi:hypothetical protein